jgi:hypothetical protein
LESIKETLTLPTGFKIRELPKKRDVGGETAWVKGAWKEEGRVAKYEQVWQVSKRSVPADKYPEVKKTLDALQDNDPISLVLEKKGGAQ